MGNKENTAGFENKVINWYPGHMTKTRRRMKECLPLVDAVVELIDARIPISSQNPEMKEMTGNKPRLILLNKADLADERVTSQWIQALKNDHCRALAVDCKSGRGLNKVLPSIREILADQINLWEQKGMKGKAIHVMVVGIPNVGKSSFINKMIKGSRAKAEDRPGVTRGNQWFSLEDGTLLLDTPGILWPKFEDAKVGLHLAFIGSIRDQILDIEELSCELLSILKAEYPDRLCERFKCQQEDLPEDCYDLLQFVGRKRGMLLRGNEVNTERAATMVLDEYRGGKFGKISLEVPEK